MKKLFILIAIIFLIAVSCAVMPTTKVDHSFSKTNEISIEKVEVFEGLKRDSLTGEVKDFGKPVDVDSNIQYQQLVKEYLASLKKELGKEGFVVIDNPTPKSLNLKTKISDDKPIKGLGWTVFGQGTVAIQTSVYQNDTTILSFAHAANYSIFSINTQVQRLTPLIAKKVKKELLPSD